MILLHDRYAFILRLSLSKAFFESQSQDSSRRKYSAAAPLIPISEQGVVLLWAVYTRRISAFCAIFWHFLVQNFRKFPTEFEKNCAKNSCQVKKFLNHFSVFLVYLCFFTPNLAQKRHIIKVHCFDSAGLLLWHCSLVF